MLIKITESCLMNCTHCADSCSAGGAHMDWNIFVEVVDFVSRIKPVAILISGGEPFDHPFFFDFMDYLIKKTDLSQNKIIVLSNGMFLENEEKVLKALSLDCVYQITNDRRYYPKSIVEVSHPKFIYENSIRHVVSLGRARENKIENGKRSGTKCFNIRALSRQMDSLEDAVRYLALSGKGFCTPSIDISGDVKPGEFSVCKNIGNVKESIDVIYERLKEMELNDCDACGDTKYLSKIIIDAFKKMRK